MSLVFTHKQEAIEYVSGITGWPAKTIDDKTLNQYFMQHLADRGAYRRNNVDFTMALEARKHYLTLLPDMPTEELIDILKHQPERFTSWHIYHTAKELATR